MVGFELTVRKLKLIYRDETSGYFTYLKNSRIHNQYLAMVKEYCAGMTNSIPIFMQDGSKVHTARRVRELKE